MIIAIEIVIAIIILAEMVYNYTIVTKKKEKIQNEVEEGYNILKSQKQKLNFITESVCELQTTYDQLRCDKEYYDDLLKQTQSDIITINSQKEELVTENTKYKDNLNYANEQYLAVLEKELNNAEREYDAKIVELQNQEKKVNEQIAKAQEQFNKLQNILTAAAAAYQRQEAKENAADFYTLRIPPEDIEEIKKLQELNKKFREPVVLNKLIWKTYVQKRATELINRILGTSARVCGVYKITNLQTQQVYIGQSVNISDRLLNHIKCGLGIDAPATKLYKAMYETGVWNFSFELMEKCDSKDLNEVERTLIELYKSAELGYNSTKGNK